ncbi:MAG: 4-oxalocrotonate tautomerase family protein [Pseudomonadota bacterium]
MPYVNIKITREGGPDGEVPDAKAKAAVIDGVTQVLADVLGKQPETTVVVIEEIPLDSWGIGGRPVLDYRASKALPT